MTILSIRTVGDPVLRTACDEVTVFDADLEKLIADMLETMYDVGGVGLAGPQVGISRRIFTFGGIDDREGHIINPVLEKISVSPAIRARCTGAAPRQAGRAEKCRLIQP